MKIITHDHCASYGSAAHPENPRRIQATIQRLRLQEDLPIDWVEPTTQVASEIILRAHTPELLARLEVPEDFDEDTPHYPGITQFAYASVGAALDALAAARNGENVFSLMRPPGHHATKTRSMGFCFLNNIAIAALEAQAQGFKRIAVFDFDVHHGNGTEDILLNRRGIEFYSVHQHRAYPDTGSKNAGHNCFNYPVATGATRLVWRAKLFNAIDDLRSFRPELIAVSAGFDAYVHDPLADGALIVEDFYWLGQSLRQMGVPFFTVLEGGYSQDLPELILAYLQGVAGK